MDRFERICILREGAVAPSITYDEFRLHFFMYFQERGIAITQETYGDGYLYACSRVTPVIGREELIVGRALSELSPEDAALWQQTYERISDDAAEEAGIGQDSHMSIDYDMLLRCGINGILKRIDSFDATPFYISCRKCLQGVALLSQRYAALAQELALQETNERRAQELRTIAAICAKVPMEPAESFYEAVQAVHFVTYCLSYAPIRAYYQQYQLGHPDRYLLPFYEKDLAAGTLTGEEAQELLDCLGIQINRRVPRGLSSGYMVGGRDEAGNTVCNDLTMMGLQVIGDVRLVYPAVGLCYHKDMPDKVLEKACELLAQGCSHPAIFNDDVIQAGLLEYGVPQKDTCNYIHSTCVEITPVGASNVWVASPYTNLAQILLDAMDREYSAFAAFLQQIKDDLKKIIGKNFLDYNEKRKYRAEHCFNPLLSCFVDDCLASGRDIEHGGARYNWIMPSFVGMGNLADSLYAVKTVVFDKKEMTMVQLKKVLDQNFEGNETLRLRLLHTIAKYGNDHDEVDELVKEMTGFLVECCKEHTPIYQNARLVPSVFCWVKHEMFGSQTGATPDGRPAGFPLGDGSGPCQGREKHGPTASILSSTKWSHKELIGGVAVNMKFSKKHMTGASCQKIIALIKTYMARGGFQLQINVLDGETLRKAKQQPEQYGDLVVRIGGYSDYFVHLSENMQDEVILRTEHEV
ncbi:MAG: hypothetical protein J6J43_00945 [Oscillospiraceae bacterium]|nr:hypothetical protein [Oscillospiraceae bacterium]